ncbi:MAG TPA: glutathionylspermidine synthase family protein [Chloroflexota bacterium]|nr:glutathionylspermidine synthase family protein [Chloroflexota bacterium]
MARAGRLHARAAAWYATAPAAYPRRWDEHLHRAAFRYYLYDNTVAGERYLALDALTLSPALHARLVAATETLARVFQRAVHAVRRERALVERLGFNWAVAEMLAHEPVGPWLSPIGRFDFLLDRTGEWRLLEYNSDTPSGIREALGAGHLLATAVGHRWPRPSAVLGYRLRRAFARQLAAAPRPVRRVGIVTDAGYAEDFAQALFLRDLLAPLGHEVVVGDLDNLAARRGRIRLLGRPLDALYRLYPVERLYGHPLFPDLMAAVLDGRLWLLNPLVALLAQDKALLAWLWAHRTDSRFPPAEQAAIARHLPETYLVEALPPGLDLSAFVVKEFFGREGEEVYFADALSPEDWARCQQWRTFVVQRRVASPPVPRLVRAPGGWRVASGVACIGSYVAGARWAGHYVRLGDAITTNRACHAPLFVAG